MDTNRNDRVAHKTLARNNGRFVKHDRTQKTKPMLEAEARIGCTLEEDYKNRYLSGNMGQKRLANRWGVRRATIFNRSLRHGTCWVDWLDLPRLINELEESIIESESKQCPLCNTSFDQYNTPDRAHWHSANRGGKLTIRACSNCNRRMENGDPSTIARYLEVLLPDYDRAQLVDIVGGILEYAVALRVAFHLPVVGAEIISAPTQVMLPASDVDGIAGDETGTG